MHDEQCRHAFDMDDIKLFSYDNLHAAVADALIGSKGLYLMAGLSRFGVDHGSTAREVRTNRSIER
ncbi:hypothetical protein SBA5_200008 [Candidatus Sulfotelmatomonas gaucii]|uniref:Uncharacterized protein n=1 Tax=Candidatus Sulfuritelmatomonas gaucii TaxID=2043161 RepID=A0A2N9L734_9BACT|nr:hypothetical protein SBA5_200008 [Candidatus Sulfotelmatomonas gaucii]